MTISKISCPRVLVLAAFLVVGATLCAPTRLQAQVGGPVTIIGNSDPLSVNFKLQGVTNMLQTVKNTFAQIREAHQAVIYQAKMIEALKSGDLKAFADAMNYQTKALGQVGATLEGFDYLKENEKFAKLLKSDTLANLKEGTKVAQSISGSATDALSSTNRLLKNIDQRNKQSQAIHSSMAGQDSIVTQLQLQQQGMGLLSKSIDDLLAAQVAKNNFDSSLKRAQEFQEEVDKKRIDKLYKNKTHYRRIYTDKDFEDKLTGAQFKEGF